MVRKRHASVTLAAFPPSRAFPLGGRWRAAPDEGMLFPLCSVESPPYQSPSVTASPQGEAYVRKTSCNSCAYTMIGGCRAHLRQPYFCLKVHAYWRRESIARIRSSCSVPLIAAKCTLHISPVQHKILHFRFEPRFLQAVRCILGIFLQRDS